MTFQKIFGLVLVIFIILLSFKPKAQIKDISAVANELIADTALTGSHIGICIYDPTLNEYSYKYNSDKYFIPASNTKLFTTYVSLKFLGDSLEGIRYRETKDSIYLAPTGDPTLLVDDFNNQRVYDFLKSTKKPLLFEDVESKLEKFGVGWAWDDYNEDYMAERNTFPLYGNVFSIECKFSGNRRKNNELKMDPTIKNINIHFTKAGKEEETVIKRGLVNNDLEVIFNDKGGDVKQKIPFCTNGVETAIELLKEKVPNLTLSDKKSKAEKIASYKSLKSQPTDSVLRKMMFESDNFFAEQLLLMSSSQKLGYISDRIFIDSVLSNELNDLPQKPKWVDGSGLSRYNLFTPESFIYLLNKMKYEFGMERLKSILPTGGKGTLKNYFQSDSNFIFAKTGTLSNHSSLCGYLITKKGKLLIFSLMANNYFSKASSVRKSFEKFLKHLRNEN